MQVNSLNAIIYNNMLQHAVPIRNDLIAVPPVPQEPIDDGHGAMGALVLIGLLAGEPIYRTTHTAAHHMEEMGVFRIHWPPLFPNIWLPECELLQIDVTIRTQLHPVPPVDHDDNDDYEDGHDEDGHDEDGSDDDGYDEDGSGDDGYDEDGSGDDGYDDDGSNDDGFDDDEGSDDDYEDFDDGDDYDDYNDGDDYDDVDDDGDYDYDDLDYEEEQEIEATIDCLDKIDIKWINFNNHDEQ